MMGMPWRIVWYTGADRTSAGDDGHAREREFTDATAACVGTDAKPMDRRPRCAALALVIHPRCPRTSDDSEQPTPAVFGLPRVPTVATGGRPWRRIPTPRYADTCALHHSPGFGRPRGRRNCDSCSTHGRAYGRYCNRHGGSSDGDNSGSVATDERPGCSYPRFACNPEAVCIGTVTRTVDCESECATVDFRGGITPRRGHVATADPAATIAAIGGWDYLDEGAMAAVSSNRAATDLIPQRHGGIRRTSLKIWMPEESFCGASAGGDVAVGSRKQQFAQVK